MVKVKVSYETQEELDLVTKALKPYILSVKEDKGKERQITKHEDDGKRRHFQRAYIMLSEDKRKR